MRESFALRSLALGAGALVLIAGLTAAPLLFAQEQKPEEHRHYIEKQIAEIEGQIRDEIQTTMTNLNPPAHTDKPVDPDVKSPTIGFAGINLGASVGSTTGTGTDTSVQGGLRARAFGEGSHGPQDIQFTDPETLRQDLNNKVDTLAHLKLELMEIQDPAERDRKLEELRQRLHDELRIDNQVEAYGQALTKRKSVEASKPTQPLYVLEFDANYNMVGANQQNGKEGMFTGGTLHGKAGVGFAMKDYGKNGCTMYFLLQGNVDGQAYYKMENADSAQINAGIEQGPLCQIGHAVTVMLSPSVQLGGAWHELTNGNMTDSGWLNYAGHARVIVDGKMYLAVNGIYRPAMGGSSWSSSELNTTADYKISDQWYIGLDGKTTQFNNVSGTQSTSENRVSATATLIF